MYRAGHFTVEKLHTTVWWTKYGPMKSDLIFSGFRFWGALSPKHSSIVFFRIAGIIGPYMVTSLAFLYIDILLFIG